MDFVIHIGETERFQALDVIDAHIRSLDAAPISQDAGTASQRGAPTLTGRIPGSRRPGRLTLRQQIIGRDASDPGRHRPLCESWREGLRHPCPSTAKHAEWLARYRRAKLFEMFSATPGWLKAEAWPGTALVSPRLTVFRDDLQREIYVVEPDAIPAVGGMHRLDPALAELLTDRDVTHVTAVPRSPDLDIWFGASPPITVGRGEDAVAVFRALGAAAPSRR